MALFTIDGVLDVAQGPNYLIPSFVEEVPTLPSPLSPETRAGFLSPQDLFFLTPLVSHSSQFYQPLILYL